jgi:hypothetical protein
VTKVKEMKEVKEVKEVQQRNCGHAIGRSKHNRVLGEFGFLTSFTSFTSFTRRADAGELASACAYLMT